MAWYWPGYNRDIIKGSEGDHIHLVWSAANWKTFIETGESNFARLWNEREQKRYEDSYQIVGYDDNGNAIWDYTYDKVSYNNQYDFTANIPGKNDVIYYTDYNNVVNFLAAGMSEFGIPRHSYTVSKNDVILAEHANNLAKDMTEIIKKSFN